MATTTNFGWTTPDDTALVKDGASAIRTLGSSIDTSMAQLKGGTTGQILSKTSNTDMAFTWIANDQGDITEVQAGTGISIASGTGPIPVITNSFATAIDAKGDIVAGTGADTFARLAVGTNGQYLQADSTAATGLKWATLSQKVVQIVTGTTTTETSNSTSTYADTNLTATITPTSASNTILVFVAHSSCSKSGNQQLYMRLMRGATSIAGTIPFGENGGTARNSGGVPIIYLDSPATTSATTYKTQFMASGNVADVTVQYNNGRSTIVLVEVGA